MNMGKIPAKRNEDWQRWEGSKTGWGKGLYTCMKLSKNQTYSLKNTAVQSLFLSEMT